MAEKGFSAPEAVLPPGASEKPLKRFARRSCYAATVLCVIAWAGSLSWRFNYDLPNAGAFLSTGCIGYAWRAAGQEWERTGWRVDRIEPMLSGDRWGLGLPHVWTNDDATIRGREIPLWLIVLTLLVLAGALGRGDRAALGSEAGMASRLLGTAGWVILAHALSVVLPGYNSLALRIAQGVVMLILLFVGLAACAWGRSNLRTLIAVGCVAAAVATYGAIFPTVNSGPIRLAFRDAALLVSLSTLIWGPINALVIYGIHRLARRYFAKIPIGCCQQCGYDLTGNISGRCPECGTPCEATSAPRSE